MHENTKSLKETKIFLENLTNKLNIKKSLSNVQNNAVVKYEDLYKIDLKIMKFLKTDIENIDIEDLNRLVNYYNITAEIANSRTQKIISDVIPEDWNNDFVPEDWYDNNKKIDFETMPESPSRIKTKEEQEFNDFGCNLR